MPQTDPRPRCTCPACAACLTDEQARATRRARKAAVATIVACRLRGDATGVRRAIARYRRSRDRILHTLAQTRREAWQSAPSRLTVRGGYDVTATDDWTLDWHTIKALTEEVIVGARWVVLMRPAQAARLSALVEEMGHIVEVVPRIAIPEECRRAAEAQLGDHENRPATQCDGA